MALYHFSEDPNIKVFVPRPPLARPEVEPLVWAIDEWHQPMYYVPRDCPRVCIWPISTTTPEDQDRFFAYVADRMVVAIEAAWLEPMRTTRLYRYILPGQTFEPLKNDAWMYISRETVTPLRVDTLDDLPRRMVEAGVELRICSSLVPLGKAVIASSLHFSLIRMRNAKGWDNA
jgi:hypothetical protein